VSELQFSNRLLRRFAETVSLELGPDQFSAMLTLSNLPADWKTPDTFLKLNPSDSAHHYAALQAALRTYFGRGARGVLWRVGKRLWNHLLEDAGLGIKAQAAVIRRLPLAARRKPTLDLLAKTLGVHPGDITVHTLDLDLLLVDHASPSAHDQRELHPICFITQGLIAESLYWSTGAAHDVEEVHCKAQGADSCEFKIMSG
jgi:predicted hydrocarbon binding protein